MGEGGAEVLRDEFRRDGGVEGGADGGEVAGRGGQCFVVALIDDQDGGGCIDAVALGVFEQGFQPVYALAGEGTQGEERRLLRAGAR